MINVSASTCVYLLYCQIAYVNKMSSMIIKSIAPNPGFNVENYFVLDENLFYNKSILVTPCNSSANKRQIQIGQTGKISFFFFI